MLTNLLRRVALREYVEQRLAGAILRTHVVALDPTGSSTRSPSGICVELRTDCTSAADSCQVISSKTNRFVFRTKRSISLTTFMMAVYRVAI